MVLKNLIYNGTIQRWLIVIGIAIAVFIPRLTNLGTILTIDEPLWQDRGVQFIKAVATGHFDQTLVAGQPGVTTTWLSGITAHWHSLAANQAAVGLSTGLAVLIITYFAWLLGGPWWAGLVGFWLALDPFLISYSRVIHTDALLAVNYLASLCVLLVAITDPTARLPKRYIIFSGFLAGLAILTKLFGVLLIPTAALIAMGRISPLRRQYWLIALLWSLSCGLTCFILWPALWTNALTVYDYLFGRVALHAGGTRETTDVTAYWWYYPRELWYHSSIPTILFALIGLVGLVWRPLKNLRYPTLSLLLAGIGYAVIMSISIDKGERYILFTFLTLIIVASYGLYWLLQFIPTRSRFIVATVVICWMVGTTWSIHPYYLAFYNQTYPWVATHRSGWGEGLEQAASWLKANHPGVKVATFYPRVLAHFYQGDIDSITHIDDTNADFAILYRGMLERAPGTPEADIVHNFLDGPTKPVKIIYINGLPYVWIYALHS